MDPKNNKLMKSQKKKMKDLQENLVMPLQKNKLMPLLLLQDNFLPFIDNA